MIRFQYSPLQQVFLITAFIHLMLEQDLGSSSTTGLIQSVTAANPSLTMAMEGITTDSLVKKNANVHVVSMHNHFFILLAIHHLLVVSAKHKLFFYATEIIHGANMLIVNCVAFLDAAELSMPPPTDNVCQTEFPQAIAYPHE